MDNRDGLPGGALGTVRRERMIGFTGMRTVQVSSTLGGSRALRESVSLGGFAGRKLRRGMERDLALSFLNQLGGASGGVSLVRGSGHGQMVESRGGGVGRAVFPVAKRLGP